MTIKSGPCSGRSAPTRSEEHTSELQSLRHLVCRLLLEKSRAVEKQDVFDKGFDVLHFNNGQLFDVAFKFVIVPVPAHLGVEFFFFNDREPSQLYSIP